MKRRFTLLLVLTMVLSLIACGSIEVPADDAQSQPLPKCDYCDHICSIAITR